MRFLILVCMIVSACYSCKNETSPPTDLDGSGELSFGIEFDVTTAISVDELLTKLAGGDSLAATVVGPVGAVCQSKGCWMDLISSDGTELFVEFKNSAFTMPSDIVDRTAIITGMAYVDRISVEELRAVAREDGLSEEEIANITEPKEEFSFIATGVRLK